MLYKSIVNPELQYSELFYIWFILLNCILDNRERMREKTEKDGMNAFNVFSLISPATRHNVQKITVPYVFYKKSN